MEKIIINGKDYAVAVSKITLASLKKYVQSVANARKIERKDLRITMPNGRTVVFKDLDRYKDMVVEQNSIIYMGADVDDGYAVAKSNIEELMAQAYKRIPVSFDAIGKMGASNVGKGFEEWANDATTLLTDPTSCKLIGNDGQ